MPWLRPFVEFVTLLPLIIPALILGLWLYPALQFELHHSLHR